MNKESRTVARFTAAFALARLAHMLLLHLLPPSEASAAIASVSMFAVLGLLQGLSLTAYGFNRTLALGVCSAAAGGLLYALSHTPIYEALAGTPALAGYGLLAGALLGGLQLIVLRRLLTKPLLWPLLLALTWALGYAVEHWIIGLVIESADASSFNAIVGAGDVLASMIIGGITGVVFILLHGDTDERARRTDEAGQKHSR